jgi:predicted metal-dependent hydrolase
MDKSEEAIRRGHRAKALIEDDLLKETFATLEQTYIARWRDSADIADRETLWRAVRIVGDVRDELLNVLNNGKIAQAELERLQKRY